MEHQLVGPLELRQQEHERLLADDGRFIIEVEYIGNILRDVQFERFYLDRIFYYSLTSLHHLFARHDMSVVDAEHIEPHGGSLQVTIVAGKDRPALQVAKAIMAD